MLHIGTPFFWWKWQEKDSDINGFLIFFNLTAAVKREDDGHNESKKSKDWKRGGLDIKKRTVKGMLKEDSIHRKGQKSIRNQSKKQMSTVYVETVFVN